MFATTVKVSCSSFGYTQKNHVISRQHFHIGSIREQKKGTCEVNLEWLQSLKKISSILVASLTLMALF